MAGKKKEKPLQHHKFLAVAFSVSAVSGHSDQVSDKPKLLGMKCLEDRTYYLVKRSNAGPDIIIRLQHMD